MTHFSLGVIDPPATAADPTITFTWDAENDQALPGGATFTRASVKQEFDGTDFTELSSGTIPQNSAAAGGGAQGFNPEPAATNLIPQSNNFGLDWTVDGVTQASQGVTDIGLLTGRIDAGTGSSRHRLFPSVISGSGDHTYAIVAQAVAGQYLSIRADGSVSADYAISDLVAGTITEEDAGITDAIVIDLGNDWYRFIMVHDVASSVRPIVSISNSATPGTGSPSFVGSNETFDFGHVQTETGLFPTSPVLRSGTSVPRAADVLDTGITITTAFSALLDVTLPVIVGAGNTITLLGPDTTAEDVLRVDDTFNVIMDDGGTPVTIGTASAGARIKVAYGRDAAGRSASLDGATAVTGGAPGAGHVGDNFQLGAANSVNQSRCIHHLSTLFSVKKSDAELEALAT